MRKTCFVQTVIATLLAATLFAPGAALAEDANAGVTVVGYGQASAPADSATLQMVIGDAFYGGPSPAQPGETPGAEEREAVAPVLASLANAGVAEDNIDVLVSPYLGDAYGYGGPGIALLRVELSDPDTQRIVEVVDAASAGAAEARLIVGGVSVSYGVDDCAALEREAREGAIADARENAEIQAELLGVTIGNLEGSRDLPAQADWTLSFYGPVQSSSACAPMRLTDAAFGPYAGAGFDPTGEAEVVVYAQVELTFGMASGAGATPAP